MEIVFQQVLKFFTPAMLQVPSPALEAPANWIIPIVLWVSLARYLIALIRDEHFHWLAEQIRGLAKRVGGLFNESLTYPESHPLREMFADLGGCIINYLFGIYFFLYAMVTGLLSLYAFGDHEYKRGAIEIGLWIALMCVSRWYTVGGAKARVSLEKRWAAYPRKSVWAIVALGAAPMLSIAAAFVSNQFMPAWH